MVHSEPGQDCILYIDRHLVHEVTSAQAFEGLRLAGRTVRRPELTFATMDHNVPTTDRSVAISDPLAAKQIDTLVENCREFAIECFQMNDPRSGIVHIIGPELGITQPGQTVVCGDSHTSTHGALGALAFGIGTSEVEHVLATQTLLQRPSKTMEVRIDGALSPGVTAKDAILAVIGRIGTAGGTGYVIEYTGDVIASLSMEARMTVCNMTIEAGARAGIISPDDTTIDYLEGRAYLPADRSFSSLAEQWSGWASDAGCSYDTLVRLDGDAIEPQVTWGTSPGMVAAITQHTPLLSELPDDNARMAAERALTYMGLEQGMAMSEIPINRVFIGSCTNGRIEDLRDAARVARGHSISATVDEALVVPGSQAVKRQAESEGLDRIFTEAGFQWREPGCSMCLAMNADRLEPGDRCASTSNRNFEGRQGKGGRTHLVSPAMAVAAAVSGHLTDVRSWDFK